jgi:integrase
MSTAKWRFGNQNDAGLRGPVQLPLISTPELRTAQDLLTAIKDLRPNLPIAMLRTTACHVSNFLNTPTEQLPIAALVGLGPRFRDFLRERRYAPKSVRSYSNYLAILLRAAQELGWHPQHPNVPEEWKRILRVMLSHVGCGGVVHYAIQQGKHPSEFCDDDLDASVRMSRSHEYQAAVKNRFRRALLESDLAGQLPGICCSSQKPTRYSVPLRLFPTPLRNDVETLLKWKQDVYAEGRPRGARHRAISAKSLEACITRFYGFVTKVEKRKRITTLAQLVTKKSVASFINWSLNERRLKSGPFASNLRLLCAAMRWNPKYKGHDFGWFRTLLSEIQPDPESEKRERKASKYLPYETLESIPAMIRARRNEVGDANSAQVAILVHDELLLLWLVTLVWRQRNIRECQIGRNLFKAEVPPLVNIAVPQWAQQKLRANPREEFWQFYFREDETKTHREVRSILPLRLVPLLEEYLERYRPILARDSKTTNLFLSRKGHPFTRSVLASRVSNLTLRYRQKRVTPHLFRDIFAFYYLKHHPRDYLTLSKMLWHTNIQTTIRIYGSKFDESHALCWVEEWLDSRGEGPECPPQAGIKDAVDQGGKSHSKHGHGHPQPGKEHSVSRKRVSVLQPGLPLTG